jgi:phosphohistidine phosphatase SixA
VAGCAGGGPGRAPAAEPAHDTAEWLASRAAPRSPAAIFLVRHAEKASNDPHDPDLSEIGRARAAALAGHLAGAGVTRLFATEYRRTRQTLQPLADATGLEIEDIPARDGEAWRRALRDLPPGATAVVAGHSNTIPGLACDLGGPAPGLDCDTRQLPDDAYDDLFLVVLPPPGAGAPRTIPLRYAP